MLENRVHHEVSDELTLGHSNENPCGRIAAFARNDRASGADLTNLITIGNSHG